MGLTMGQRKAVAKAYATRYRWASKADKGKILDELCGDGGVAPQPCPQGP